MPLASADCCLSASGVFFPEDKLDAEELLPAELLVSVRVQASRLPLVVAVQQRKITPTDTPPTGESNSASKTAESSSDNAEPMEY